MPPLARRLAAEVVSGDLHAVWLHLLTPLAGATARALAYQLVRREESA